nr:hypothetical protein [Tanacetum cinerariifolium]
MVTNNASKAGAQTEIKESFNVIDVSTKDISVIELSEDEAPVPANRKRGRLVKDSCFINSNVVEIVSSDDEKEESLADTKMVDVTFKRKERMKKNEVDDLDGFIDEEDVSDDDTDDENNDDNL